MAKLFWLQPDNTIVEFPLKAEQNLIGRSSRCDVRIKHPGISAEHALIRVLPGSATVEDLNSTNGTRVNGRRVESHTLRHGDQIGVGRERLMYFAELDEASRFAQPESIEPFAQPAPGGETVNTDTAIAAVGSGNVEPPVPSLASSPAAATPPVTTLNVTLDLPVAEAATPAAQPAKRARSVAETLPTSATPPAPAADGMPELDPALLASLPRGTVLTSSLAMPRSAAATAAPANGVAEAAAVPAPQPVVSPPPPASPPVAASAAARAPAAGSSAPPAPRAHALTASVAVLSGPAVGKRYPLDQPSVTLGKEGKQVIELVRTSPTRWQLRQREGVTPAYVNGDALAGNRDLVAGDVIELIGVRLRFEVALAS